MFRLTRRLVGPIALAAVLSLMPVTAATAGGPGPHRAVAHRFERFHSRHIVWREAHWHYWSRR
jgi:hypothetical protein